MKLKIKILIRLKQILKTRIKLQLKTAIGLICKIGHNVLKSVMVESNTYREFASL
jgi:hypothetical protein